MALYKKVPNKKGLTPKFTLKPPQKLQTSLTVQRVNNTQKVTLIT